ncbi:MAG: hypothetical protein AAF267_15180 [Deinococcota bacterium]
MYKHGWSKVFLLLFLVACSTTSPNVDPARRGETGLLAIADLHHDTVTVQALVPGLAFSVVDRSSIDSDGVRVQEITYQIENTSDRDLSNLTLYGISTPNTLAGTNVSGLRDALGSEITNTDMAPSIISVHGSDTADADMQAFVEEDRVRVKALLDEAYPENSFEVLSRGFVASNITGQGNRSIAVGEQGVVTIAVQYPYDPENLAGYPNSFALTFAFVDEDITRVTQGDNESNEDFVTRVTNTFNPLPDNLEIVTPNPDNPPQLSTNTTILKSEALNPPIAAAPTTSPLPTQFSLSIVSGNVTTDVDITITIAADVQRTVEVLE